MNYRLTEASPDVKAAIALYDRTSAADDPAPYYKLETLIKSYADCGVEIMRIMGVKGRTRQVLLSGSWFKGKNNGDEYCVEARLFTPNRIARSRGLTQLQGVLSSVDESRLVSLVMQDDASRKVSGRELYFSDLQSVTKMRPISDVCWLSDDDTSVAIDAYDKLVSDCPRAVDIDSYDRDVDDRDVKYATLKRSGMLRSAAKQAEQIIWLMKRPRYSDIEMVNISDENKQLHNVLLHGFWDDDADEDNMYSMSGRIFPTPGRMGEEDVARVIGTCHANRIENWVDTHIVVSRSRLVDRAREVNDKVNFKFSYAM